MAEKRNSKASFRKKTDKDYIPDKNEEDTMDHIIDTLEKNLENTNNQTNNSKKQKRAPTTSGPLNIKEFEENEAKEDKQPNKRAKTQPTPDISAQAIVKVVKAPKSWAPAESALLRALIIGLTPTGRNVAGILSSSFVFFCFSLS